MGAQVSKIKHLKLDQWEDAQVRNHTIYIFLHIYITFKRFLVG